VAQFTSAGTERWKAVIADALLAATGLHAPVRALRCPGARVEGCPCRPAGCAARAPRR
jgi:23S rRNA (cytosine1962-C5)-methyltransferase